MNSQEERATNRADLPPDERGRPAEADGIWEEICRREERALQGLKAQGAAEQAAIDAEPRPAETRLSDGQTMSLDPDRELWDENRWAWDDEQHTAQHRAARQRLVSVLHRRALKVDDRAADDTPGPPTEATGPFWRRWWGSLLGDA